MNRREFIRNLGIGASGLILLGCRGAGQTLAAGPTGGNVETFTDDGGWCWFQDERAIIHNGKLLFGGVTSKGDITVTSCDLQSGRRQTIVLHERLEADDHNVPALLVRPDGRYLAAYSKHSTDRLMRYRISTEPHRPDNWRPERTFDVGGSNCYSNLYHLADEGVTYNFHRGRGWDPNYLLSNDAGDSWRYGGKLMTFPDRPYPRYASNHKDSIHFVVTEAHPRDYTTSIWHGFMRAGQLYNSKGTAVARLSTSDRTSVVPTNFTQVFAGNPRNVAWTSSIELDAAGNPYIGYSVTKDRQSRGSGGFDHRYRWARWDGQKWHDREIAYAGTRLYPHEDEYTGLITVHPRDPNVVYISADVDPVSGRALISQADGRQHYEIFRGLTADGGRSWSWQPVTKDSAEDNIRPIVAADTDNEVLIWLAGTYKTYTDYNMAVVGLIIR